MPRIPTPAPIALFSLAALAASPAIAPASARAAAGRPIAFTAEELGFDGQSTLHPFSCRARRFEVKGTLAAGGGSGANGAQLGGIEVVVPVKDLTSGDGALDANMFRALDADRYPEIRFDLDRGRVLSLGGDQVAVDATGRLRIHGVQHPVVLHAEGRYADGRFRVAGHQEVAMSAFGVTPPALMLGAIRVRDQVVVRYSLEGEVR